MKEENDKCLTCGHWAHMHNFVRKRSCFKWTKDEGRCTCIKYNNDPFERMISNIDKPKEDLYGQMS